MTQLFFTYTDQQGDERSLRISRILWTIYSPKNASYGDKPTFVITWVESESSTGSHLLAGKTATAAWTKWKKWTEEIT